MNPLNLPSHRKGGTDFVLAYEVRTKPVSYSPLVPEALEQKMSPVLANIAKGADITRSWRSHKLVEKAEIEDCVILRRKSSELEYVEGDEPDVH
jgi:hypothetical protein